MSLEKSALEMLAKPMDAYGADLKNPSYREAHKALVKVLGDNIQLEKDKYNTKSSTQVRLALVGVLALAVTITACVYIISNSSNYQDDNRTKIELMKLETKLQQ